MDALAQFKAAQREGWSHFAPLEAVTVQPAARLVRYAGIRPGMRAGQRVLDVGCGTGVVAITAARLGARVTGLDLTPALLERARENARIAGVEVEWQEGDVEQMTLAGDSFDVVLSQYGHMFAPRPELALAEMLRVLKPGGTIAFSTWPPELFVGRMFALVARYQPPPPPGVSPPTQWGDPNVVRARLGALVKDIAFDSARMLVPTLSPQHQRELTERTAGPVVKLIESLAGRDASKLDAFRREYEMVAAEYFEENALRQDYLLTRATKL